LANENPQPYEAGWATGAKAMDGGMKVGRTGIALFVLVACGWVLAARGPVDRAKLNRDPDAAKLVTSDFANFWRAYDLAAAAASRPDRAAIFKREYLDKGSPGLKDFLNLRINSADALTFAIEHHPKYYASLKNQTPRVAEMEPGIRASFRKLRELYNDAVFPDVYFLIGVMNSGGTTGDSGLLIGFEMNAETPETDMTEMDDWHKAVLGSTEKLPGIVAHELIHYQQVEEHKTLLAASIHEGSADFIGEMISGMSINDHLRAYGDAHEADLWREFSQEMNGNKTSNWLYQGDKSKDRPADLGYYVGYRIAQSYYEHASDKKQAIRDILTVSDFASFLRDSHYGEKFGAKI
jgi:hypothetical protein